MARQATKDSDASRVEDDEQDEQEFEDEEYEDDEEDEEAGDDESGSEEGGRGIVDSLMSQLGEHKAVLAPVATSAAAAAATYAAKKLPDLIEHFEQDGGNKIREKLGDASNAGGMKGFAAGAASRAFSSGGGGGLAERLKQGAGEEATEEAEESGGVTGAVSKMAGKLGGSGGGGKGWGKGRRLPITRSIDVAAPLETVYDQWTQLEEMNTFMHRVESVDQEDDEVVNWSENIWGRRRQWKVQITEQVPNERIAFEIKSGGDGTGVVTFHELAPRLTRVEVIFDWQPHGMIEKLGSGLRFHERAARSDLRRFKAFVETRGEASGGWQGRIEDGKAKGQTRNKRNRSADPVDSDERQHTESDERKVDGDSNGDGNEDRDTAREERKRHRSERAQPAGKGRS